MIKKLNLTICLLLFVLSFAQAQKKYTLDNVVDVYLRSSGAIIENNQVKGYFFMYITDKIDKKTNQYNIQILDQNLNHVKQIVFEDSKDINLLEAAYNGNSLAFIFRNSRDKSIDTRIYGTDGNLRNSYTREYDSKIGVFLNLQSIDHDESTNKVLFSIGEKGFVGIYPTMEGKKYTYQIDFYSSKEKKQWTYAPEYEAEYAMATFLGYTDSLVLFLTGGKEKLKDNSSVISPSIEAFTIATHKKVFSIKSDNDKYTFAPSDMSLNKANNILLTGIYYDKKINYATAESKGVAVYTVDTKGKVLNREYNTWKEDIAKLLSNNSKEQTPGLSNFQIEKFVPIADGKTMIVGESYERGLVKDLAILEINNQGKIDNAFTFPKVHNKVIFGLANIVSLQVSAYGAFMMGQFDYEFANIEGDNSGFSVIYKDYLRKDGIEKLSYSAVRYSGNKFSTDKFNLNSKADIMRVYPAKSGSIMILEYFKKEKRLDARLEKLG